MAHKYIVQRNIGCLALLAMLAACGHQNTTADNIQEAKAYQQVALADQDKYAPPGPASDPWGPYITEAASRFDVPQRWIRAVMQVESGGHQYINGQLTTSPTGAMGLMQVEPETYDDLRSQYGLGNDAYEPHDNIMAGTAYLRQMYDQFGVPGFLAAYNTGPGNFSTYLAGKMAMPDQTRQYVAMIAPNLGGDLPIKRSPNDGLAYNYLPVYVPAGRRRGYGYGGAVELASNETRSTIHYTYGGHSSGGRYPLEQVASNDLAAPVPPTPPGYAPAPVHHDSGLSLVSNAYADELPPSLRYGGAASKGSWAIQVGAYANRALAHAATVTARQQAPVRLARATTVIGGVAHGSHMIYRARLGGLSREQAESACAQIHSSCMVISPATDS